MRRPDLDNLPPVEIPEGYELRAFQPGDEEAWERIVCKAFEMEDCDGYFDRRMCHDLSYSDLSRIFIIWKANQPVATASAWFRSDFGPETGYLHMVAVDESERGRGLGYQISLVCLHKMKADGRKSAVLRTEVKRIPAIKTYLKLGFEPCITGDEQKWYWDEVWRLMGEG